MKRTTKINKLALGKTMHVPKLKVQFVAAGRREIMNGVDYAVYPVTMLVEGVHHGAVGDPVYYSTQVLEESAEHWNGVPLTYNHPYVNGQYCYCNTQQLRQDWAIGFVSNVIYANGKLKGEAWVDINKANAKDANLIPNLDNGFEMEVSTGLGALDDNTPISWNNEAASSTITEIFPDHLALLTDSTGACSFDDGCGIRANASNKDMIKAMKSWSIQINELSHEELAWQIHDHINAMDAVDNEGNYTTINFVEAIYDNYFIYRQRVGQEVTMYRQGYSVDSNDKLVLMDDLTPVKAETRYLPIVANKAKEEPMANKSADNKGCCPKKVAALIANENSAFTENDVEWLNQQDNATMDKLIQMAEAKTDIANSDIPPVKANSVSEPVTLDGYLAGAPNEVRAVLNAGLRALDKNRGDLIATIIANASNKFTEDTLKGMDLVALEGIAALAKQPEGPAQPLYFGANNGATTHVNADHVEEPYVPITLNTKRESGK